MQGKTNNDAEVVPPKHGSERVVSIPDELVALLSEHVREIGVRRRGWFFGSALLLNRNSAGHQWRQTREAAASTAPR